MDRCLASSRRRDARSCPAACCALAALLAVGTADARQAARTDRSPRQLYGELFVRVQSEAVFADGKTFVDAVPREPPRRIMQLYRLQRPGPAQALRSFVEAHFELPRPAPVSQADLAQPASLIQHIDGLWPQLTRHTPNAAPFGSLLPLPRPYVVPGGRFREIYYWDSYFTLLGVADGGAPALLQDMVDDFAFLIDTYGHVPNGTRTYYLSRSQPPFFYAMVGLLQQGDPAAAYAHYLRQLRAEHAFWMAGAETLRRGLAHRRAVALPEGLILNRYWDDRDTPREESYREDTELARHSARPAAEVYRDIRAAAESGWDFSTRWFDDPAASASIVTTDVVPVDLNSLLFGLEQSIAAGCQRAAQRACAVRFARRARARHRAIDRYLWDPDQGVYLDYRRSLGRRAPGLSAATLYPLFVGAASAEQASAVAASVRQRLLGDGGLVTTQRRSGQQWDAPNGWAPLQWIAIAGLRRYHQDALAATIACRFMASVEAVYRSDGKLVEKYDVLAPGRAGGGGEYPLQDGFGWTNGVVRRLLTLYPQFADVQLGACP